MIHLPDACFNVSQIRMLEHLAMSNYELPGMELMERAGACAFESLQLHWPKAKTITVICGGGNNGGDGYILARIAKTQRLNVRVYYIGSFPADGSLAQQAAASAHATGVHIESFDKLSAHALQADVIIDAILGIGLKSELSHDLLEAINIINDSKSDVLSIDIPSGLMADTGDIGGACVKATVTCTFIGLKPGLFTAEGRTFSGLIDYHDLALPKEVFANMEPVALRCSLMTLNTGWPKRPQNAHKGLFGHVLVVGGDHGMGGAIRLASEASARVGAGLVTVATRPEHMPIVSGPRPELMCRDVHSGTDLVPLIKKATVVVIGPGLGQSTWSKALLQAALDCKCPLVVDADALNLLAEMSPKPNENWILTPHPGEAARLLGMTTNQIQADRFAAITQLRQRYGGVIVLKGAGTLIRGASSQTAICDEGNPGMASGGMGDVLSGVIGGILAQGLGAERAARLAVCLHAHAGDRASRGGERGLLALDLMPYLREFANA